MLSIFRNSPGSTARPQRLQSVSFMLSAFNLNHNSYSGAIYSICPSLHVDYLQLYKLCTAIAAEFLDVTRVPVHAFLCSF